MGWLEALAVLTVEDLIDIGEFETQSLAKRVFPRRRWE